MRIIRISLGTLIVLYCLHLMFFGAHAHAETPKPHKRVIPKSHKHKGNGRCLYADGTWIKGCR